MTIKQAVFRYLDDGKTTLVFPTENSARHYLAQYVRECRTSVLASRAIALDTFAQMFSPKHEQKPSNKYHRLAFVASWLDSGDTGLGYLYKDDFHEYRQRFVSFLAGILPSLCDLGKTKISNDNLFNDLRLLRLRYSEYLSANGLFEPGWENHSLQYCSDLYGDYVLVGYDADIQMQRLLKELENEQRPVPHISTLCLACSEVKEYEQYKTEEAELTMLFERLETLKNSKVPMQQIVITTPKLEDLAPRLERKALEYDIPLSFVKSVKLSDTVPGRYLFAVRRCINENLSFHALENLLLNTALPFSDMELNRSLIRFMIDNNHQGGSLDFKDDKLGSDLFRKGRKNPQLVPVEELYKKLKSALGAIRSAHDGDELIKDIHGLTAMLLGNDEFDQGNETDRDVYSFIFSELGNINRALKASGLEMDNIFSIFMGEVDRLSYVQQKRAEGIRVYGYGQDYLMNVPHRFIIGLDDSNSVIKATSLDFLEDHEVSFRESYDVTGKMLDYYMQSSNDLHVSGSASTYEGSANAPTYFVVGDSVKKVVPSDRETSFHKVDVSSYDVAKVTAFAPKGSDAASGAAFMETDPANVRFSYTSISNYAACPYKAMLAYEMTKGVPEDFEPSKQNDRKIGTALHDSIQSFMARHFNEYLDESHLDEYHAEIRECLEEVLEKSPFDDFTKQSIRGKFLGSLTSVVDIMLSEGSRRKGSIGTMTPVRNELELESDPRFIGYIDSVVRDNGGETYLIDYKKGSAPATYQLILYKRLYENSHPNDQVKDAFFYSMKDRSFSNIQAKRFDELEQKLDADIESAMEGYRSGSWKATPDAKSCLNCSERRICRRRFNLR